MAAALDACVRFEGSLSPRLVRFWSRSAVGESAATLVAVLGELSDHELLGLDRRARPWWWEYGLRERGLLRAALGSKDRVVVRAAAAAGALSPDGYVREAAVRRLAGELPWSFSLLAVRATDWVGQVQDAAMDALEPAEAGWLVEHLSLLEQLSGARARGRKLAAWKDRRLASDEALDALSDARFHAEVGVRRAAWRRLGGKRPELVSDQLERALSDPDHAIRLWAVRRLEGLDRTRLLALAPTLLKDPVGRIRAEGLSITFAVPSEEHDRLATRSLADRSAAVRHAAQAYLAGRSYKVSDLYTDLLRDRVTAPLVLGLAESGGQPAAAQLERFLDHHGPSIRRAALRSLAVLAPDRAVRLAVEHLSDESEPVARDALRVLAARSAPAELATQIEAAGTNDLRPLVRTTALSALRRRRWRSLGLALAQLNDRAEQVRTHANEELHLWLKQSAHAYYGPTQTERSFIERHLANASTDQRRAIEFVMRTTQAPK
jgi:HEAT repeat protein